ncbi:MAG: TerB family tellurite resistance protein [Deltaproteobacteria bacterium]|jgi:DnaJ like chaperone protein|nr:TerB family tellurite resistance protein [Deltaproteobacteria bacterium]
MGWFGKITFGTLGLFLGGPLGAIAGAALGHVLVDKGIDAAGLSVDSAQGPQFRHAEQTQASYFISLFSILGKLSKIDGAVTRDEIAVVDGFINNLPMSDREKQFARQVFNEAKNSDYSIEDFALQLFQIAQAQPALLISFFDLLFQIAAADGTLHPAEETALKKVKDIFRISDKQFEDIKAIYFKDLDKYYKILNCTPESSNEEIKANYKKLVKDFHPDTIISKGLPEEFIDFASNRFREIHESYDKIRRERNF